MKLIFVCYENEIFIVTVLICGCTILYISQVVKVSYFMIVTDVSCSYYKLILLAIFSFTFENLFTNVYVYGHMYNNIYNRGKEIQHRKSNAFGEVFERIPLCSYIIWIHKKDEASNFCQTNLFYKNVSAFFS